MTDGRIFVIGNSHVWTLMGWGRHAGHHESVRMDEAIDGLELVGIAVTGATAHNLIEESSSTGGGPKAHLFLDADPDRLKSVLAVFGDIDLRHHVRGEEMCRVTLDRYLRFLDSIASRPDVRRTLVASVTGFHGVLADCMPTVLAWNATLADACRDRGWTFVDLLTPGAGRGTVDVNHLEPAAQGPLLAAVRAALRGEPE